MKHQPYRLQVETRHQFAGAGIDRAAPLRFRLNGRTIHGYAGDTILSAVLASGVLSAGRHRGQPIALGNRFAPAITLAGSNVPLPMERVPALDGAEFQTLSGPAASRFSDVMAALGFGGPSLELDLDRPGAMARPWLHASAEKTETTGLVVIGAGLAGLSAALAAARSGHGVVLVESSPTLGGHARLFGTLEGEAAPDQSIAQLGSDVLAHADITVLRRARAIAVRPGVVRVHAVTIENKRPTVRVTDYRAPAIIIATGTIERLPFFAGNRQPGVVGAMEAFDDAYRYGLWRGRSALVSTVSSPAYRLAMLASDASITISRIIDGRPHPQSRFIEFAKAYGITQSPGNIIARARWQARKGLAVTPQAVFGGMTRMDEPILTDCLVACGGWQPDLSLWHMAGGKSIWNAERGRIEPLEDPPGIALAGSAAGYLSSPACFQSGEDTVRLLLGGPRVAVTEHLIDPIYETPDDPAPLSDVADPADAPAYLDAGTSLLARNTTKPRRHWSPLHRSPPPWSLADHPQALDIGDVAAGAQLGLIPAAMAGTVAAEHAPIHAGLIAAGALPPADTAPPSLRPAFLEGRFGPEPALWTIIPVEPRRLETGTLIFISSDQTDPRHAIGVVLRAEPDKAIALIARHGIRAGETVTLRDQNQPIAIRLAEPYSGD